MMDKYDDLLTKGIALHGKVLYLTAEKLERLQQSHGVLRADSTQPGLSVRVMWDPRPDCLVVRFETADTTDDGEEE
jgi:hypothetical protein